MRRKRQRGSKAMHLFAHKEGSSRELGFLKMCGYKDSRFVVESYELGTFSTYSSCKLDVFWHNGDSFCVDGAQVGVFEKAN